MVASESKYSVSKLAVFVLVIVALILCVLQVQREGGSRYRNTDWDALGYYLYTPALLLHNDVARLDWYRQLEDTYHLQGGHEWYQFSALADGKRVGKYFTGVAVMQSPFFLLAHTVAPALSYPADGFSFPYQLAVALAALTYAGIALLLLRKVLLRYLSEPLTALTLLLTFGATNFLQYAAVDCGQVHIYAMFWYAAMLYVCAAFYESPSLLRAGMIGFIAGMATLCRPTEAVIVFLPLLWGAGYASCRQQRTRVFATVSYAVVAILSGIAAIIPQILYWKHCTGQWVYDVGSKWDFLTPHLRVLWGWEKGWFIYTPLTLLFVMGLFCMRPFVFFRAALVYFLLNIWIVTAWSDWLYGGSFSARALVQALPVCALSLGALLQRVHRSKLLGSVAVCFLVPWNVFQTEQYNRHIIDYKANNRAYYGAVFGRMHPDVIAYSLLEGNTPEPCNVSYRPLFQSRQPLQIQGMTPLFLWADSSEAGEIKGYRIDLRISSLSESWDRHFRIRAIADGDTLISLLRIQHPYFRAGLANDYALFLPLRKPLRLLSLEADRDDYVARLERVRISVAQ